MMISGSKPTNVCSASRAGPVETFEDERMRVVIARRREQRIGVEPRVESECASWRAR